MARRDLVAITKHPDAISIKDKILFGEKRDGKLSFISLSERFLKEDPVNLDVTDTILESSDLLSVRTRNLINDIKNDSDINKAILDEMKKISTLSSGMLLETVTSTFSTVFLKRKELDGIMDDLYSRRLLCYENLLTTYLGAFYYNMINLKYSEALDYDKLQNTFDVTLNDKFIENLDAMYRVAVVKTDISNTSVTFSPTELQLIKRYAKYFYDLYEDIKESAGLENTSVTYEGMKGFSEIQVFSSPESKVKGSIQFTSNGTDVETIEDVSNIDGIKVNVIATQDMIIQDGSKEYPFIINKNSDFTDIYLNRGYRSYFKLNCDVNLTFGDLDLNANLDGNGHVITYSGISIKTGKTTELKNLKIKATSIIDVNVSLGGTIENVDIFFTNSSVFPNLLGILVNATSTFECLKTDGEADISSITNLNIYSTSYIPRGLDFKKKFKVTKVSDTNDAGEEMENSSHYKVEFDNDSNGDNILIPSRSSKVAKAIVSVSSYDYIFKDTVILTESLSLDTENQEDTNYKLFKNADGTTVMKFDNTLLQNFEIVTLTTKIHPEGDKSGEDTVDCTHSVNIAPIFDKLTFNKSNGEYKLDAATVDVLSPQAATLKSLADISSYYFIEEKIAKYKFKKDEEEIRMNNDADLIYKLLLDISALRYNVDKAAESAAECKKVSLDYVTDMIQSFSHIEGLRAEKDSFYDTTYSTNLSTVFEMLGSYISMMNNDYGTEEVIDAKEEANKYVSMIGSEINTLVLGLTQSIILLNKELDNYLVFHDIESTHGKNLVKAAKTFSDVLLGLKDEGATFKVIAPAAIRSYDNNWSIPFGRYSNDGASGLAQLYMSQELGINLLGLSVSDTSTVNSSIKSIVNDIILRMYRKKLLVKNGKILWMEELDYERILANEYNISVNEDAPYESVTPQLGELDSKFLFLNNIDVTDILLNDKSYLIMDDHLNLILEMNFIEYILSKPNASEALLKVRLINDVFKSCKRNFKTLLMEYHFRNVLKKIVKTSEGTNSILNPIIGEISEYSSTSEVEELIKKYIAVWMFNYFSQYSESGSILRFMDPGSNEIVQFLYNYSNTKFMNEFSAGTTFWKEAVQFLKDACTKVKDLWNNLIDWIF